jgi:cyclophilin family peptidyl-prolyl cis-trans isomerase
MSRKTGILILAAAVMMLTNCGCRESETALRDSRSQLNSSKAGHARPRVELITSKGRIVLELEPQAAPVTVDNFLNYVRAGHYNGLIFHRVIAGFMIQGGGFDADLNQRKTNPPIINESQNGLKNDRGTVAMARTSALNSATSQFFINVVNNDALNYPSNGGYAVFGKVVEGMDVVDAIAAVPTTSRMGMRDVPVEPVVIQSATVLTHE